MTWFAVQTSSPRRNSFGRSLLEHDRVAARIFDAEFFSGHTGPHSVAVPEEHPSSRCMTPLQPEAKDAARAKPIKRTGRGQWRKPRPSPRADDVGRDARVRRTQLLKLAVHAWLPGYLQAERICFRQEATGSRPHPFSSVPPVSCPAACLADPSAHAGVPLTRLHRHQIVAGIICSALSTLLWRTA